MAAIEGNESDNILRDTVGDDTIEGYAGNDSVTVTTGRDYANGGAGEDTLLFDWSGAAQDVWIYNSSSSHAYVNTGTAFSDSTWRVDFWSMEHMNVTSGSGNDRLEGVRNSWDVLNGGAGNDVWSDSFSNRTTGLSIDMAQVSSSGGQSYADGTTVRNIETGELTLSLGDDTFRDHGDYDDHIVALGGDDDIGSSQGRDYADGGAGSDTMTIDWSTATDDAYLYNSSSSHGYVNTGTAFSDSARRVDFWSMEHMNVTSGSGNDRLEGVRNSWDVLNGGAGNDVWSDSFSNRTTGLSIDMAQVSSSGGQSYADGTTVRNIETAELTLSLGDDTFRDHGAFDDHIVALDGDDTIRTSSGRDYVDGGGGLDTLIIDWSDAVGNVVVHNNSSSLAYVDTGSGFSGATTRVDFWSVENIVLRLGDGADDIRMGAGDDLIFGSGGADRLDGLGGTDTVSYDGSDVGVTVDLQAGAGTGGDADGDQLLGIENLAGSRYGDNLSGDSAANVISGGRGGDRISGGGGNDTLQGNGGADRISGNAGRDRIEGDAGSDRLSGNGGADRMFGGGGNDVLNGGNGTDRLFGGNQRDVLTGARGDDLLEGGGGSDTFAFARRFGEDQVSDFSDDIDTLRFDDRLWSGSLTRAQIVDQFASQDGDDAVFSFEGGEVLRLIDFLAGNSLSSLVDDLQIV